MPHLTATPLAVQLRLLSTHPFSVPAHLTVRSTQDLLIDTPHLITSDEPAAQMLTHPPVILVHPGGGEEVLNIDCVKIQLDIIDKKSSKRVPGKILVYIIDASKITITTRTLRFIYGSLQMLHYRKKEGKDVDLQKQAIENLMRDNEIYTSVAHNIFNRPSLASRHYVKLFSASRLDKKRLKQLIDEVFEKTTTASQETKTPYLDEQHLNQCNPETGDSRNSLPTRPHHSKNPSASTTKKQTTDSMQKTDEAITKHQMPIEFDEETE